MRSIPRLSGKEGAKDVPSFARPFRPQVGEGSHRFADQVMEENYPGTAWRDVPKRMDEWRSIEKWGRRAFENPAFPGVLDDPDII